MKEKRPRYSVPMEEILLANIERREALDPNYYYEAKLSSIRRAQAMGVADSDIERMFGITLRPEDRR